MEHQVGFYMGQLDNLSRGGPQIGTFGREVIYGIVTNMPLLGRDATHDEIRAFSEWGDSVMYSELVEGDLVFMQEPDMPESGFAARAMIGYIKDDKQCDPDSEGHYYKMIEGNDGIAPMHQSPDHQVVVLFQKPR